MAIIVTGSLSEIKWKLLRIHDAAQNREVVGYRALQHDENWGFLTERDARVCKHCRAYEHTNHRGDYILRRFPNAVVVDYTHIKVNLHIRCRCWLEWWDYPATIQKRLTTDLTIIAD